MKERTLKREGEKERETDPPIRLCLKIFPDILPLSPFCYKGVKCGAPGSKQMTNLDKSPIETFHFEFCKNILGVHRNGSNLACRAELGGFPLFTEMLKRA